MESPVILETLHIRKEFSGVVALDDVSIGVAKGEVHALLGENGAGKSTLIKILSGALVPTSGEVRLDGIAYAQLTPVLSQRLGISVIYQELALVPYLPVYENIFLGGELRSGLFVRKAAMIAGAKELLESLRIDLDPRVLVKELSIAQRQIVEIVKAVRRELRILIMDEPSASLTTTEVEAMFGLIGRLKAQGRTIIYISHRIEELFRISDRITVLRDGRYIDTVRTPEVTRKQLVSLMVGRDLVEQFPRRSRSLGDVALEVKGLNAGGFLTDIALSVRKGEILGIAGLVGAGRTTLARILFGADSVESGEIVLGGRRTRLGSPAEAIRAGVALIPEDRKEQGVLLKMSVLHNITLPSVKSISRFLFISDRKDRAVAALYISRLRIKTPTVGQAVMNLSGGNQQKIVIAKWLATNVNVLVLDEPTRGIDVGAKQEIYELMNELAADGMALIMISSEMPELIGMSDRIIVMREGSIAGELSKDEVSQEKILHLASSGDTTEAEDES